MGIDAQIEHASLSAGSDPQKLMQRYQQSKSLIDLLAMQKLKSEKDEAARALQLKMQQQPGTIVEQREAELMGANRQELMQKMGPTLARTGAESMPQNAPQLPQGGPRPPGQSGIASASPSMGFAKGGIVQGYEEGGYAELSDEDKAIFYKDRPFNRINPGVDKLPGSEQMKKLVEFLKVNENLKKRAAEAGRNIQEGDGLVDKAALALRGIPHTLFGAAEDAGSIQKNILSGPLSFLKTLALGPQSKTDPAGEGLASLQPVVAQGKRKEANPAMLPKPAAPVIAQPAPASPEEVFNTKVKDASLAMINTDPDAEAAKRQGIVSTANVDVIKKQAEKDALRKKYEAMYNEINDPKKLRNERLKAFLAAGARGNGLGHFADTASRALAGSTNARQSQEAQREAGLAKLKTMLDGDTESARKSATDLANAGIGGLEAASKAKNTGMLAASQIATTDTQAKVKRETNKILAEANALTAARADKHDVENTILKINEQLAEISSKAELSIDLDVQRLERIATDEDSSSDEKKTAREKIAALRKRALAVYKEDRDDLLRQRARMEQLLGVGGGTVDPAKDPKNFERIP